MKKKQAFDVYMNLSFKEIEKNNRAHCFVYMTNILSGT